MVSVCIATYNGEKYIYQQVYSILKQLNLNDEIIISDDGSTDNTIEILRDINDDRIRIMHNKLEKGYTKNFENAIRNAKGKFIFLCDQDDVWFDNKVAVSLKALETSDFVVSDALFVNQELESLDYTFFGIRGGRKGFFVNLLKSQYLGACMAFNNKLLKKLLPFPEKSALCPHDLWISLIAELYFKSAVIKKPLISYRRHGHNVSTGGHISQNSIFEKLKFRTYCLYHVLLRCFD